MSNPTKIKKYLLIEISKK